MSRTLSSWFQCAKFRKTYAEQPSLEFMAVRPKFELLIYETYRLISEVLSVDLLDQNLFMHAG